MKPLLIRLTKHKTRRTNGIPKAVGYLNQIFDPASEIEALIEAYGAAKLQAMVRYIEAKRLEEYNTNPDHFKLWSN